MYNGGYVAVSLLRLVHGVAIEQEVVLGIKWHEQEMLDLEHWPLKWDKRRPLQVVVWFLIHHPHQYLVSQFIDRSFDLW